mgnify:CR=1 FL=1
MSDVYSYQELAGLIPENRPLLMVDRLELDREARSAAGVKAVTMNEPFFQGHFPGGPIMPGVLQVAAMKQVAGALLSEEQDRPDDRIPVCTEIARLKFRSPVVPGDFLRVTVEVQDETDQGTVFRATCRCGETVTSQGRLTVVLRDRLPPPPEHLEVPMHCPVETDPDEAWDIRRITGTIPHRFPFLLIDRVLKMDTEALRLVAYKNVSGGEEVFAGAASPAFPGYLQIEAAAQAGCTIALSVPGNENKLGYFMSVDTARFLHPVHPGDQLLIDMHVSARGRFGKAEGTLYVGETPVTEAALKFAFVDREQ